MKIEHGYIYAGRVLSPIKRPPLARRRAIDKAVREVVARMPPPKSYCICGKRCAVDRKIRGLAASVEGEK